MVTSGWVPWTLVAGLLTATALPAKAAQTDPFEGYYGNTLVCVAAVRGNDLCHTWVYRNGTFITFDPTGMHQGHWKRGPTRADGKTPICWYDDSTLMVMPQQAMSPMGPPRGVRAVLSGPPPGAIGGPAPASLPPGATPAAATPGGPPGLMRGGLLCDTVNFHTTCTRYQSAEGLTDADKARLKMTIVERFHAGMCYPLPVKHAGDTWYEDDDPLPGENGLDKLFLLKGHR